MKALTGAILLLATAILVATLAIVEEAASGYGGDQPKPMVSLATALASISAVVGVVYLALGSVPSDGKRRWHQYTIRTVLALALLIATFFAGRATGLKEASEAIERLRKEAAPEISNKALQIERDLGIQ